jgi:hypothetical protein
MTTTSDPPPGRHARRPRRRAARRRLQRALTTPSHRDGRAGRWPHRRADQQPSGRRHRSTPDLAAAVMPPAAQATATAVDAARAWATAANSSSYLDPNPGAWTVRARPLTTPAETRAEAAQRTGGGGITYAHPGWQVRDTPSQSGRQRRPRRET